MQQFTDEQIQEIRKWMPEIHSISDLQTKINTAYQTHLTYLQTRFLMDDFNLQLTQETPQKKANVNKEEALEGEYLPENSSNSVQVTVDPVTRPGFITHGHVTFSDGQTAEWSLDQMGRIGLNPAQKGYRPSAEDIALFQENLQQKLSELSQHNAYHL